MLENRAFDHMLGFSGITGTDAATGSSTSIHGLSGNETNTWNGETGRVSQPADNTMAVDPGHEFTDVLCQLAGANAVYAPGAGYPAIDNSGFMASYAKTCAKTGLERDSAEVLKCFSPAQLPVLNVLASAFAICDNWHASIPAPLLLIACSCMARRRPAWTTAQRWPKSLCGSTQRAHFRSHRS
jgi:phospholipase C